MCALVTGVQTCALPIWPGAGQRRLRTSPRRRSDQRGPDRPHARTRHRDHRRDTPARASRHGRDTSVRSRREPLRCPRRRRGGGRMSTTPTVTPELKALLRRVKLGRSLDTLPERLALAQTGGMGHAEFLELVLADEVTRRENTSADRRARTAGLDPTMTLDRWDDTAKITYDRAIWNEMCSLRFVAAGHNTVLNGPVGVGKPFPELGRASGWERKC